MTRFQGLKFLEMRRAIILVASLVASSGCAYDKGRYAIHDAALTAVDCTPLSKKPTINDLPKAQRDELIAAMSAIEFWDDQAGTAAASGTRQVMAVFAAKDIIYRDTTYGSGNRKHRALTVCLKLFPEHPDKCLSGASAGSDCVAGADSCMLKHAHDDSPEADIKFSVSVPTLSLQSAACVLDPQTWDKQLKTSFANTFRTTNTCPDTSGGPPNTTLPDAQVAEAWEGALYEHYAFNGGPTIGSATFHTSLCFDAEYSSTNKQYRIAYELCDPASYGQNVLDGASPVQNALTTDGGYCHANADVDPTNITCVKRIELHEDICPNQQCVVEMLHAGLRNLMRETAIALSYQAGIPDDQICKDEPPCFPPAGNHPFDLPTFSGIDPNPNRCGMTQPNRERAR